MIYSYGNLPVPGAVMWSDEESYFLGVCPWFKKPAICQWEASGQGVPRFGRPHVMRQRKMLKLNLCDLCMKSLHNRTRISLSNFGANVDPCAALTQVEPLLHVECARKSLQYCPSLRRQIEGGRLRVKQVLQVTPHCGHASAEDTLRYLPNHDGSPVLGLASLQISRWRDVTSEWLAKETQNAQQ